MKRIYVNIRYWIDRVFAPRVFKKGGRLSDIYKYGFGHDVMEAGNLVSDRANRLIGYDYFNYQAVIRAGHLNVMLYHFRKRENKRKWTKLNPI